MITCVSCVEIKPGQRLTAAEVLHLLTSKESGAERRKPRLLDVGRANRTECVMWVSNDRLRPPEVWEEMTELLSV